MHTFKSKAGRAAYFSFDALQRLHVLDEFSFFGIRQFGAEAVPLIAVARQCGVVTATVAFSGRAAGKEATL
jgi:hypothetical protein